MISDETLAFYFYDDGLTPGQRRDIDAALLADPDLAARYAELSRQLNGLQPEEDVAVPDHMLQRWHDSIDQAARTEAVRAIKSPRPFHLLSFAWGGAIAAVLALVIGIYFVGEPSSKVPLDEQIADATVLPESSVPVSFTRGLQVHLRDSQVELSQLPADADRSLLLLQIIEQNRIFERVADSNNAADVARLLRAFEPILMRLASDDIAPDDAEALRAQLAFELNVMLTKLANSTSDDEQTI